jgi:hypothetical protein
LTQTPLLKTYTVFFNPAAAETGLPDPPPKFPELNFIRAEGFNTPNATPYENDIPHPSGRVVDYSIYYPAGIYNTPISEPAIQSLNRHKEKRRLKELPGVLSAGQIAVPPGGSPHYLPAVTVNSPPVRERYSKGGEQSNHQGKRRKGYAQRAF